MTDWQSDKAAPLLNSRYDTGVFDILGGRELLFQRRGAPDSFRATRSSAKRSTAA